VLPKQTTSSQSIKENLAKSGLASTHTGRVTQSTKPARMIHGTKARKVSSQPTRSQMSRTLKQARGPLVAQTKSGVISILVSSFPKKY
jgi:hypothetical protein